jgi:hypothetical protein
MKLDTSDNEKEKDEDEFDGNAQSMYFYVA